MAIFPGMARRIPDIEATEYPTISWEIPLAFSSVCR
jgi:hypothetical protein